MVSVSSYDWSHLGPGGPKGSNCQDFFEACIKEAEGRTSHKDKQTRWRKVLEHQRGPAWDAWRHERKMREQRKLDAKTAEIAQSKAEKKRREEAEQEAERQEVEELEAERTRRAAERHAREEELARAVELLRLRFVARASDRAIRNLMTPRASFGYFATPWRSPWRLPKIARSFWAGFQCSDLLYEVHRSHKWKAHRNHRNGPPWHPLSQETAGHSYAFL